MNQKGFALVMVLVATAVITAVVEEFSYHARVDFEAAANARDQLRAEYLARSGINLSRLLIKTQASVIDPINRQMHMDIQIGDFAPLLMKAFGGGDGAAMLGDLLGIGTSSIKGLGVGKGAGFDVEMAPEDGKINLNCAGGLNAFTPSSTPPPTDTTAPTITNQAQALYAQLTALFFPPRYNRLFDIPDADGQYATRDLTARALIDWSDIDENQFDPLGASGNSEDYRYDGLRDPYKAHNNYYDTLEELQLVKGVGDDFWGAFGELFTVYGSCKVNINAIKAERWPISAALLRAAAKNPSSPALQDDVIVSALAQQIGSLGQLLGGVQSLNDFVAAAKNGGVLPLPPLPGAPKGTDANSTSLLPPLPGVQPIELNPQNLAMLATVGPRQIYRIDSTGTIERGKKRVTVHVRAVFDTQHFNQNTTSTDPTDRMGAWVYWRMD